MAEFQAGIRELGAAARALRPLGAVHEPFTGMHSHVHYDLAGGQHQHSHSHDGDADHGHDHDEIDAAVRSAEAAKRTGQARRRLTVLNSAERAAQNASWERLARTAAELERERDR